MVWILKFLSANSHEVDGNVTSEAISRVSYDLKSFRRPNVEKLEDLLTQDLVR